MSTLPATNKEFGVARHTDPDTTKEAAASVREQNGQICGKKKSPIGRKCHVYELVL